MVAFRTSFQGGRAVAKEDYGVEIEVSTLITTKKKKNRLGLKPAPMLSSLDELQ